jgi:hypothetical protein
MRNRGIRATGYGNREAGYSLFPIPYSLQGRAIGYGNREAGYSLFPIPYSLSGPGGVR